MLKSITSERLKEAMLMRDMKQVDLAIKTGLGKSAISQYLSGKVTPKQDKIHILAKALSVDELWLMGISDSPVAYSHNASLTNRNNLCQTETKKMPTDLKRILEEQMIMFDGEIISDDDKEIVKNMLITMYEIAKKKNKRKK